MYAMVKKVTRPPRNSRANVEPRLVIWKNWSRKEFDTGGLLLPVAVCLQLWALRRLPGERVQPASQRELSRIVMSATGP